MLPAADFIAAARRHGFGFFTGVPCSYLTPLINGVLSDHELSYVGATSEGESVAIAAGAWLAGARTVVMCQNSGLGNAVNPLTSLNAAFDIPTLLITTWRGEPGGAPDEPQHALMGAITPALLSLIEVAHAPFPDASDALDAAFDAATRHMDSTGRPFAWVMRQGDVAAADLDPAPPSPRPRGLREDRTTGAPRMTRAAALAQTLERLDAQTAVVATTGKCGRELFTLADRRQHLYQVGSMGGASGMALGIALNTPKRVLVIDGDGAALMKLGTLATIGAYAPSNLVHLLLDNGVHDSTGGQATVSSSVDFAGVALACGYAYAALCDDQAGFAAAWTHAITAPGPALIHLRIAPGSMAKLGRPTIAPREVARRFQAFLAE